MTTAQMPHIQSLAMLLIAASCSVCAADATDDARGGTDGVFYTTETVNPTLPPPEEALNLETPQACVENFMVSGRSEDWRRAAASLNFRLVPNVDRATAEDLARRLFFVIQQEMWVDWEALPDRPDGMMTANAFNASHPLAGQARKSIHVGSLEVDDREVSVRVQRIKPADAEPIWLFSAQSVDNIELLYDAYGPSWLAEQMPTWSTERSAAGIPLWQWIGLAVMLVVAVVLGMFGGAGICRVIAHFLKGAASRFTRQLRWPAAFVVGSLVIWITLKWMLNLPSTVATLLEPLALVLVIAAFVWLVMRIMSFLIDGVFKDVVRRQHPEETSTRGLLLLQITVARHVVLLAVALIGLAIVLLELDVFRTVGIALLSSAGAAAVVLGIAGHAVLGNLIAGLQIALAQPFSIGDTVYVEQNWGRIEDITYVNVVVRTWDERRLVFPIRYFVTHWFENWSRSDAYLIKPIYLQVDYRVDVEMIRRKFEELVRDDEDWDAERGEAKVLVTGFDDETMTVRCTSGASDPGSAWALSCRLREKMIAWLQGLEDGAFLPRRRILLNAGAACHDDDEPT